MLGMCVCRMDVFQCFKYIPELLSEELNTITMRLNTGKNTSRSTLWQQHIPMARTCVFKYRKDHKQT